MKNKGWVDDLIDHPWRWISRWARIWPWDIGNRYSARLDLI